MQYQEGKEGFNLASPLVGRKGDLTVLVAQAAAGLAYMHGRGYLHRDVKPQNILVVKHSSWPEAVAKLADFGTTRQILMSAGDADDSDEEQVYTRGVGTGIFRAPEMRDGNYNSAVDIYSFGRLMEYLRNARTNRLFRTSGWREIEEACMAYDPYERPNAEDLKRRLIAIVLKAYDVRCKKIPSSLAILLPRPQSGYWPATAQMNSGPQLPHECHHEADDWRAHGRAEINAAPSNLPQFQSGSWRVEAQMNSGPHIHGPEILIHQSAGGEDDSDEVQVYVYVCATARTSQDQARGTTKRGMKYHRRLNCIGSSVQTTAEIAESFAHTPCKWCY